MSRNLDHTEMLIVSTEKQTHLVGIPASEEVRLRSLRVTEDAQTTIDRIRSHLYCMAMLSSS